MMITTLTVTAAAAGVSANQTVVDDVVPLANEKGSELRFSSG